MILDFAYIFTPGLDYFAELKIQRVAAQPYELAASGQVMALFGRVMRGMVRAALLAVPGETNVWGWQFSRGSQIRAVLVNLKSTPVQIDSYAWCQGFVYTQAYSNPQTYMGSREVLHWQQSTVEPTLELPAFSITTLEKK